MTDIYYINGCDFPPCYVAVLDYWRQTQALFDSARTVIYFLTGLDTITHHSTMEVATPNHLLYDIIYTLSMSQYNLYTYCVIMSYHLIEECLWICM